MSLDNRPEYSGGCQCGAVRFHLEGALGKSSVCHCRMCQKAFGAFYAPLVEAGEAKLEWTRGRLSHFRSSNQVLRGFCSACGTPLTYESPDGVALAVGAFDDPTALAPIVQWGREDMLPYVSAVPGLPAHDTADDTAAESYIHSIVSCQHPDHDTETWPPEGRP